jgi:hypothetical protein
MQVAEAIREVMATMQRALAAGERSTRIDANDLIDLLLAIADELDPAVAGRLDQRYACPGCGERDADQLHWQDDDKVLCAKCGMVFVPG